MNTLTTIFAIMSFIVFVIAGVCYIAEGFTPIVERTLTVGTILALLIVVFGVPNNP